MVEFAIVLPLLAFLFLVVVDFCRIFYFAQVVTNCARNGAVYLSDPVTAAKSPYTSVQEATKADAGADIGSQMTISSQSGSDSYGDYVHVTVDYPFQTITSFPGIPNRLTITRTVEVRVASAVPQS